MNYTNTRIYSRALELVRKSQVIIDALPQGYGFLADQLRRAAASVVLNFAEGCGKNSPAERRRYFQIARASAYEVAAAVDVAYAFTVIADEERVVVHDLCDHICAMLIRFTATFQCKVTR